MGAHDAPRRAQEDSLTAAGRGVNRGAHWTAVNADDLIGLLGLRPHPEGGHYVETWRDSPTDSSRGVGSAIHFLLRAGERSHWHRVDADELWLFHDGAPLELWRAPGDAARPELVRLGRDLRAGEQLCGHVPVGWWQAAVTTGAWTLVSCIVCPAFEFDGFHLAPPGFEPG